MSESSISDAEWEVMNVLWAESPKTASEVAKALPQWKLNTVRTLLDRLVRKEFVTRVDGSVFRFEPAVSHAKCVKKETKAFLKRVFDGSADALMLHLVEHEKLPKKQASKLKSVIEKKKK